jgi:AcrR family transcriptional regulator
MIELCARDGYQNVSVAQISSEAGVSSATFYEQFEGKEDCLLAAFRAARARVYRYVELPDEDASWSQAARQTLAGLFAGLQSDPSASRLLFVEALAGGSRVRAEREDALNEQERRVEDFLQSRPEGTDTLDIPVLALEGARRYIVSRHLRTHSEDLLASRLDDLVAWMACYAIPARQERWSNGTSALLQGPAPALGGDPPTGSSVGRPRRLPRGRHGLPPSVVARSQRTRIIAGTAETVAAKGYVSTTVADIVAAAGVSRDVFYGHFTDKENAFLEAQQFATQAILNTCASAYFSATAWPERVWRALDALLKLIAEHPAIAYIRLVESYAAGAAATRNIEEFVRAATIFLEEGFTYRDGADLPPRLSTQAICGGVLEVVSRYVARGENAELHRYLPQLAYIALAPFMGVEQAIESVTQASAGYGSSDGSE